MTFRFNEDLMLEDARVLLRPMVKTDADKLLHAASKDPELLRYSPSPITNRLQLQAYVDRAVELRATGQRYTFTVLDKLRNAFAGSTSYLHISPPDDRLEIGATWYGPEFQRSGLNRHCKLLLLTHAFEVLGAERVEFRTDERNAASRKAIEGIGGCYEGLLRQHMLMPDGFRRNTVCYSILKEEWPALKAHFPIAP